MENSQTTWSIAVNLVEPGAVLPGDEDDAMIVIDGSHGESGGQIVRSSLALSILTGQNVTINNIRAKRKNPGLARQHLTAVEAAQRVSAAKVHGAGLHSSHLVFQPKSIQPGDFTFEIGTAGSTTLVLQTVLPALLTASGPSNLVLRGGTHNPLAPPYEFLARAYLPLVEKMGPQVFLRLLRHGFYPAGGGELRASVKPVEKLESLELLERGELLSRRVTAFVANLPRQIGDRECAAIRKCTNWPADEFQTVEIPESFGPGNAVLIELEFEHVTEVFAGFGEKGTPAERVATKVADEALAYLAANVPVGEHLADQLLLPLALGAAQGNGGGTFRTLKLSSHSTTHIDLIQMFLDVEIRVEEAGQGVLVEVKKMS